MQMFINNNARFCCLCICIEECKHAQEKIKTKIYTDEELKSESDNDNDMILILIMIMKNKFRKKVNQIVIMTNKFF